MKKYTLIFTFLLWISSSISALCTLTEPEIIIFGKITNHYFGYEQTLYSGKLEWKIENQNESFLFSTELESLSEGKYSYKLEIPEKAAVIIPKHLEINAKPNRLKLESINKQYNYSSITVNGLNARIKEPAKTYLLASQKNRGQAIKIDLEITDSPSDMDNDGIPDFWEKMHGLSNNNKDDANIDSDQDGWKNIEEFSKGTDPHVSNLIPGLSEFGKEIYVSEFGKSMLSLPIVDTDTLPENIQITIKKTPVCGDFMIREIDTSVNDSNVLQKWDTDLTVSAKQVQDGWLYYEHTELCLVDEFVIELWDQDEHHYPKQYTIRIHVRTLSSTEGHDAFFWADFHHQFLSQKHLKNLSIVDDRSGNENFLFSVKSLMGLVQPDDHKQSIFMNNSYYELAPFCELRHPNDITVISVYRPLSTNKTQSIFSTSTISLKISDNRSFGSRTLQLKSDQTVLNGSQITTKGWNVSIVNINNNLLKLFHNNRWAVKELKKISSENENTGFSLGAQMATSQPSEPADAFEGFFGEFVLFHQALSPVEVWKKSAMLASKWQDYILSDHSHETRNIRLATPSGLISKANYKNTFAAPDSRYILIGGKLDDILIGGHENDILIGGQGKDQLVGNSGADIFVPDNGDIIIDFIPDENDAVDLSHLFSGRGLTFDDYILLSTDGINSVIKISRNGTKQFDQEIRFDNCVLSSSDLNKLWATGHLRTGHIRPDLTVSIDSLNDSAIETLNQEATAKIDFSISSLPQGLQIPILVSETAINGEDYTLQARIFNKTQKIYEYVDIKDRIPVQLQPGDTSIELKLVPVFDKMKEPVEYVTIQLIDNPGAYSIIGNQQIKLSISDGPDIVSLSKTTHEISEDCKQPENFILKRKGTIDHSLVVMLSINGTATNGIDFQYIPSEWTIPSGIDQISITIQPNADNTIEIPPESVEISILPSDTYQVDSPGSDIMYIKNMSVEMTLETVNPVAERNWNIPAIVNICSSKMVDSDISVQLKYSGTAVNGRDFEWLSDRINLGAGLSKVPVRIAPKLQDSMETIKHLKIEIIPEIPYICGSQSISEVYIINEKITAKDWIKSYFPKNEASFDDILNQDNDSDGLTNFEEYAYGLDPFKIDIMANLQQMSHENGHLVLTVGRSLFVSDVNYTIEISEDLSNWYSGDQYVQKISSELIDKRLWEKFQARFPVILGNAQFMRLKMEFMSNE